MKIVCTVICVVLCGGLLGGCGAKAPDYARLAAEQSFSVPHPDALEKREDPHMFTFTGSFPEDYLMEMDESLRGVLPLIGVSLKDDDAPTVEGFCYTLPKLAFGDKNPWAIIPMQCIGMGERAALEKNEYVFAMPNKDGTAFIASPIGSDADHKDYVLDQRSYDWEKFKKDKNYQKEIMVRVGRSLDDIDDTWQKRVAHQGKKLTKGDVREIIAREGDPMWEEFRKTMLDDMGVSLELPDGQLVASYLTEKEMEKKLSKLQMTTPWQRFVSKLRIPISPTALPELAVSGGQGIVAMFFDNAWETMTAQGICKRIEFSKQLKLFYNLYKREFVRRQMEGS